MSKKLWRAAVGAWCCCKIKQPDSQGQRSKNSATRGDGSPVAIPRAPAKRQVKAPKRDDELMDDSGESGPARVSWDKDPRRTERLLCSTARPDPTHGNESRIYSQLEMQRRVLSMWIGTSSASQAFASITLAMSQNSGKQLNNWPLLAGLALLLYDYLRTLPTEIHIMWPRPKPWFILVRYLALSTNFTMVVLTFGTFGSQCFPYTRSGEKATDVTQWVTQGNVVAIPPELRIQTLRALLSGCVHT
ncbi:hypothetical protein B0H14DRAFT_2564697 [Mycena olivaceomarginata]|nr:hypothetical protein B0H14DRAFT_2564697 [Mycena olivaceomarginata]